MNGLAQRLKEARKQSGLSQEKLAEAVGVSGHAVYLFERGKNRPALDTLERISAATGKPLPWFFGGDPAGQDPAEPTPASSTTVDTGADLAATVAQLETEG